MRQRAVIIDLDGVLVNSPHAEQFKHNDVIDWEAWEDSTEFSPRNEWCTEIVTSMALSNVKIIFLTARTGTAKFKGITERWLQRNGFVGYELLMRPTYDHRSDHEVKKSLFLEGINSRYEVLFAIDDKKSVIDMWRELGVPALHCADY